MNQTFQKFLIALLLAGLVGGEAEVWAAGLKKVNCSDGDHYEITVEEIAIKYNGTRFQGTFDGLARLGAKVTVEQQTLQTAAAATQQWNEFLKGLVVGYNSCALHQRAV